ncbi:MAG: crossover junction endodeoxyribonuclease RuvC [Proteobacteria bacterium]|nr:crossover junction endodeoxyribonuclease RuvC [Pseudomonadota bacterium]
MIILGIDPGLRKTGFGIVEKRGQEYRLINAGVIRLDKLSDLHDRLLKLFFEIENLIKEFNPNCISLEKAFVGKNARSAFMIGEARAVCIVAGRKANLPVYEYPTRSIKQGLTGFGGAEKKSVKHMVKVILKINGEISDDASDALAIAIFHGNIGYNRNS